jgi:secreted PhoX family phosphatase
MERRRFLQLTGWTSQYLIASSFLGGCGGGGGSSGSQAVASDQPTTSDVPQPEPAAGQSNLTNVGPLQAPDANGIRLPAGFSSRVVARSGEDPTGGSGYRWHPAPDGGAVFDAGDGGWVYVSNSEMDNGAGGVGAIRFDPSGNLVDAYPVLTGTSRNCAGGPTPWQTWLSCEEIDDGQVWECDPFGRNLAVARPALGRFNHEAAAVDPRTGEIYLTEDHPDGGWYRFTPAMTRLDGQPDLSTGTLAIAQLVGSTITWLEVPDPSGALMPTRYQVSNSTPFNGGEGTSYSDGHVYFTTKGDDGVWSYEISSVALHRLYDPRTADNPILSGVDNLETNGLGDLLIAEDGGDMEIVIIAHDGSILPLLQVVGQSASEVTGPAFTPDLTRLYFSSQRGTSGLSTDGITYEVSGPFTV